MARDTTDTQPIEGIDELVGYLAAGNKPREKWRIGTEHEKFPFYVDGNAPVPYGGERGIRAIPILIPTWRTAGYFADEHRACHASRAEAQRRQSGGVLLEACGRPMLDRD